MNRYFARLGQRSDVVPGATAPAGAREPFSVTDAGLTEETSEVVVTSPDTASHVPATTQATSRPVSATATDQPVSEGTAAPAAHTAMSAYPHPALVETTRRVGASPVGLGQKPEEDMMKQTEVYAVAVPAEPSQVLVTRTASLASTVPETTPRAKSVEPTDSEPGRPIAARTIALPRVPATPQPASQLFAHTDRASNVQQTHKHGTLESLQPTPYHYTVAAPPQPSPASVSIPVSRAPLQVHIGRIELDVHTPVPDAPTPVTPPALGQHEPTTSRQSAPFNPHRYYLRGL